MRKLKFFIIIFFITFFILAQQNVEIYRVKLKEVEKKIKAFGTFQVKKSVTVLPKIRKGVVKEIKVEENEIVEKEQAVAVIQRDDPGFEFKEITVRAPIDGVIAKINSYEGSRLSSQTPIMMINSYDPIYLSANLPIDEFYMLKEKNKAEVNIDGIQKKFYGYLLPRKKRADDRTRTANIEIEVKNPELKIIPGLYATAKFSLGKVKSLFVPADSVFLEDEQSFVWIVEGGKVFKRKIKIGSLLGRFFEIKSGLKEGEIVVVFGYENLKQGDEVRIKGENK